MAKSNADRSAKAALKRIEYGEKELRHRCRPRKGTPSRPQSLRVECVMFTR